MSSGSKRERSSVLCLSNFRNDVHTLIFVNGVRLDLASHTVTVDACVLPLTNDVMSHLSNAIKGAAKGARLIQKPDEVKAWKHLLPAFTERCRKWSHTANCEYLPGGVLFSDEINQSPLCSCGQGKHLGSFTQNNNKGLHPTLHALRLAPSLPSPSAVALVRTSLVRSQRPTCVRQMPKPETKVVGMRRVQEC